MKNKIAFMFMAISLLVLSGCASKDDAKDIAPTEQEKKEEAVKNDLIKKYHPIIFSDENFEFSAEIQDKINGNLFLLSGEINDLYAKEDKRFIKLSSLFYSDYFGIFEITDDQANFIKENSRKKDIFSEYFAVVKIDDVSKPRYKIDSNVADCSEENANNDVELDTSSSSLFLLKGKLIDIQKTK